MDELVIELKRLESESIGCLKDGAPYIGVCYNPYMKEMFYAQKGFGAFLNGKRIHVSNRKDYENSFRKSQKIY